MMPKSMLVLSFLIVQQACGMEIVECTELEKQTLMKLADFAGEINSQIIVEAVQNLNNLRVQKNSRKEDEVRLVDKALFGLVLRWHIENAMAVRLATMLCDAGANPLAEFNIRERMNISVGNEHYSATEHSYVSTAKAEAKGSLKKYLDSLAS
jgi:hypothetical protein